MPRDHARLGRPQGSVPRRLASSQPGQHVALGSPLGALGEPTVACDVQHQSRDPGVLVRGQPRDGGARVVHTSIGVDDRLLEQAVGRGREVGIHHADVVIGDHLVLDDVRDLACRDQPLLEAIDLVGHGVELDLDDHPEEPVAADRGTEQLGVVDAADLAQGPVGQDHSQRTHARRQAPGAEVRPVRIHRHGAADAEHIDAGHRPHREPTLVQRLQDLRPGRARTDSYDAVLGVRRHRCHVPHVEHQPAGVGGLSTHAVPRATDRDLEVVVAGIRQGVLHLVDDAWADHPVDGHRIDAAGVVHRPATLHQSGEGSIDPLHHLRRGRP